MKMDSLDELKQSWDVLSEELQKPKQENDELLDKWIEKCNKKINKRSFVLKRYGICQIVLGAILTFILIPLVCIQPKINIWGGDELRNIIMKYFLAFTIIAAFICDCLWALQTFKLDINRKSVVEVMKTVALLKKWMKYEVIFGIVWAFVFFGLSDWIMGYFSAPLYVQLIVILIQLLIFILVVAYLYKKLIYNPLRDISNTVDEIKTMEQKHKTK